MKDFPTQPLTKNTTPKFPVYNETLQSLGIDPLGNAMNFLSQHHAALKIPQAHI